MRWVLGSLPTQTIGVGLTFLHCWTEIPPGPEVDSCKYCRSGSQTCPCFFWDEMVSGIHPCRDLKSVRMWPLGKGWARSWRVFPASGTLISFAGMEQLPGSGSQGAESAPGLGLLWSSFVGFLQRFELLTFSEMFCVPFPVPASPWVSPAAASWQTSPGFAFTDPGICSWTIWRSLVPLCAPGGFCRGSLLKTLLALEVFPVV